jgi:NTP pyrophosphatase (non-canonical NTP hydrolase)
MELEQYQWTVKKRAKPLPTRTQDLDHALYGMASETGEIADCIKKNVIYGKPLDEVNLREELGDLMWYVAHAANSMGWKLSEILDENDAKLEKRYPIGSYSDVQAIARADKV